MTPHGIVVSLSSNAVKNGNGVTYWVSRKCPRREKWHFSFGRRIITQFLFFVGSSGWNVGREVEKVTRINVSLYPRASTHWLPHPTICDGSHLNTDHWRKDIFFALDSFQLCSTDTMFNWSLSLFLHVGPLFPSFDCWPVTVTCMSVIFIAVSLYLVKWVIFSSVIVVKKFFSRMHLGTA